MAPITVRALVLAFAFGICLAGDFKMHDSKCKFEGEGFKEEMKKNVTDCLKVVKPDAEPEKMRTENYLNETEKVDLGYCLSVKNEIISKDGVYLVDVAIASLDKMVGTEQSVKDELANGIKDCAKENDPEAQCREIIKCVCDVFKTVCVPPGKPADKEE